jgi:CO/xanthine dehydrogenase Mo-binding subunit
MLTRRRLLIGTAAVAGGGLVLSLARDNAPAKLGSSGDLEPNPYLQIRADGVIILQVDKLEMGQGVMTGFVTLLAEELGVRPGQIRAQHAPVHPHFQTPSQLTAESASMRHRWERIRQTGAAAREMLRSAAATRWQMDSALVQVAGDATMINTGTGERVAYKDLARDAALLPVPDEPPLTLPDDFRWIGKDVPRVDVPDKVTGAAVFGTDVRLPGMLTAIVLRPPRALDPVEGYDAGNALAMPGVHAVFAIPSGVAIVADGFWQARQAAAKIKARWGNGTAAGFDPKAFRQQQLTAVRSGEGHRARNDGDVDAAFAVAERVYEAEYHTPFLAHATMETMNATVRLGPDRGELWLPGQAPDLARQVLCDLTGLRREQVDVNVTYAGGGFGRRAMMDFVTEAVQIATLVDAPVQLVWSREDDLRFDYFRCATASRVRGVLDGSGRLSAWEHSLSTPDHTQHIFPIGLASLAPQWWSRRVTDGLANVLGPLQVKLLGPFHARDGSVTVRYAAPNFRVNTHITKPKVPVGIWRSVGNSYNVFVAESFADELAHHAGADPATWRREHLADQPRHLAVLERLLAEADWGQAPAGRHQGLSLHDAFDSVIGQVAEVSVVDGRIRVHRVICVADCGTAINPDVVRAQLEGAILFGLSAALLESVQIDDGRVQQSNFHQYPVLRMAESPQIDTHILESDAHPGGIGELGTPGIAPAVANAVFAATGRRLRELPLSLA